MYEENVSVLAQAIAEKSVIRHVRKHRNPVASYELTGNKALWNDAIARFEHRDPHVMRWPELCAERLVGVGV